MIPQRAPSQPYMRIAERDSVQVVMNLSNKNIEFLIQLPVESQSQLGYIHVTCIAQGPSLCMAAVPTLPAMKSYHHDLMADPVHCGFIRHFDAKMMLPLAAEAIPMDDVTADDIVKRAHPFYTRTVHGVTRRFVNGMGVDDFLASYYKIAGPLEEHYDIPQETFDIMKACVKWYQKELPALFEEKFKPELVSAKVNELLDALQKKKLLRAQLDMPMPPGYIM